MIDANTLIDGLKPPLYPGSLKNAYRIVREHMNKISKRR